MEFTQMTLDDWANMKEQLKKDLIGVQESFVRIGYTLRQIEGQQLYEKDGYASIVDFAKAEYGLGASTVSRFININKKYSIDGNSDRLRPEFAQLGSSKLAEMLTLPDSDMEMIQPGATRENIRELKQFNKQEPAAGATDDIKELIGKFYQNNRAILNEVFENIDAGITNSKTLSEIVNPGGNKSYKKGLFFLMMYENKISIKKFGGNPQEMTWEEFFDITQDIFPEQAADKTWERYFGKVKDTRKDIENIETEPAGDDRTKKNTGIDTENAYKMGMISKKQYENLKVETKEITPESGNSDREEEESRTDDGGDIKGSEQQEEDDRSREESSQSSGESIEVRASDEQSGEESQTEEIAPAQESPEILETEDLLDDENEDISIGEDADQAEEPEREAAAGEKTEETDPSSEAMNSPEVIEKPYGSRKEYMESLTEGGMAKYMAEEHAAGRLLASALGYPSMIEIWLREEVDSDGEPLE